jgi:hypothetical protein
VLWLSTQEDTPVDNQLPVSAFRLGRGGACEATLFAFFGHLPPGASQPTVRRVAATQLLEAVQYMHRRHHDFQIDRIESLGLIDMVSGSPLD